MHSARDYTVKVLSEDDIHRADVRKRRSELAGQTYQLLERSKERFEDLRWAQALAVHCFGEHWCMCSGHARWASYCLTASAVAAVTQTILMPPEDIDDRLDRMLEFAVWPHLDEALQREPNPLCLEFRQFMLRHFVPDPFDDKSDFAGIWGMGNMLCPRDRMEAYTTIEPREIVWGREKFRNLPENVRRSMECVAVHFPRFWHVYEEYRLPRLVRSIENDHAVRMDAALA